MENHPRPVAQTTAILQECSYKFFRISSSSSHIILEWNGSFLQSTWKSWILIPVLACIASPRLRYWDGPHLSTSHPLLSSRGWAHNCNSNNTNNESSGASFIASNDVFTTDSNYKMQKKNSCLYCEMTVKVFASKIFESTQPLLST